MALSLTEKSELVSSFWKDRPSACPKHEIPMRTFFVERVYKARGVWIMKSRVVASTHPK